ncbi:MAG: tetratricopeptide repeat protein [Acidiferrobacterales bacterium]
MRSVLPMPVWLTLLTLLAWFQPAAVSAGNLESAIASYQRGNYQQAFKQLEPLALHGNANAQFYLAVMYNNGQGVIPDVDKATAWLQQAAKSGHAESLYLLGKFYAAGRGVEQDIGATRRLWTRAGNRGVLEAQTGLAQFYASGGQWKRAVKWWRKAARQGDAESQYRLGLMYRAGQGGLKRSPRNARSWWRKAAVQGHVQAKQALEQN